MTDQKTDETFFERVIRAEKAEEHIKELEEKCKLYEKAMDINKFDKQADKIKEFSDRCDKQSAEIERLENEITDKYVPNQCHSDLIDKLHECDASIEKFKAEIKGFEDKIAKILSNLGRDR